MTSTTQGPAKIGLCRRLALIERNRTTARPGATASPIDPDAIEDRLRRLREGYDWI
jgi:hypothetical protein